MYSLGGTVRMEEFSRLLLCLQELYLPFDLRAEYLEIIKINTTNEGSKFKKMDGII